MSAHHRKALLGAFAGVAVAATASPGLAETPATVTVNGHELVLNGVGTRQVLVVEAYTVALYLPQPTASAEAVDDPAIAKAFHVEILYDGPGAGEEEIPEDWRAELLPVLTDGQVEDLRQAFGELEAGDLIWVHYTPESGTTVTLNDEAVLDDPGHEPMSAVISIWLGPDPVADDLRQQLLAGGA